MIHFIDISKPLSIFHYFPEIEARKHGRPKATENNDLKVAADTFYGDFFRRYPYTQNTVPSNYGAQGTYGAQPYFGVQGNYGAHPYYGDQSNYGTPESYGDNYGFHSNYGGYGNYGGHYLGYNDAYGPYGGFSNYIGGNGNIGPPLGGYGGYGAHILANAGISNVYDTGYHGGGLYKVKYLIFVLFILCFICCYIGLNKPPFNVGLALSPNYFGYGNIGSICYYYNCNLL